MTDPKLEKQVSSRIVEGSARRFGSWFLGSSVPPLIVVTVLLGVLAYGYLTEPLTYSSGDRLGSLGRWRDTYRATWSDPSEVEPLFSHRDGDLRARDGSRLAILNSRADDREPATSPDGNYVVFTSSRGADGDYDLYWSQREAGGYGPPQLFPEPVRSAFNDRSPSVARVPELGWVDADAEATGELAFVRPTDPEKEEYLLLFTSNRGLGSVVGHDLYLTRGVFGGEWTAPQRLNSLSEAADERGAALHPDGSGLVFTRPGLRGPDVFETYRLPLSAGSSWSEPNLIETLSGQGSDPGPSGRSTSSWVQWSQGGSQLVIEKGDSFLESRLQLLRPLPRDPWSAGPVWLLLLAALLLLLLRLLARRWPTLELIYRCLLISALIHLLLWLWLREKPVDVEPTDLPGPAEEGAPIELAADLFEALQQQSADATAQQAARGDQVTVDPTETQVSQESPAPAASERPQAEEALPTEELATDAEAWEKSTPELARPERTQASEFAFARVTPQPQARAVELAMEPWTEASTATADSQPKERSATLERSASAAAARSASSSAAPERAVAARAAEAELAMNPTDLATTSASFGEKTPASSRSDRARGESSSRAGQAESLRPRDQAGPRFADSSTAGAETGGSSDPAELSSALAAGEQRDLMVPPRPGSGPRANSGSGPSSAESDSTTRSDSPLFRAGAGPSSRDELASRGGLEANPVASPGGGTSSGAVGDFAAAPPTPRRGRRGASGPASPNGSLGPRFADAATSGSAAELSSRTGESGSGAAAEGSTGAPDGAGLATGERALQVGRPAPASSSSATLVVSTALSERLFRGGSSRAEDASSAGRAEGSATSPAASDSSSTSAFAGAPPSPRRMRRGSHALASPRDPGSSSSGGAPEGRELTRVPPVAGREAAESTGRGAPSAARDGQPLARSTPVAERDIRVLPARKSHSGESTAAPPSVRREVIASPHPGELAVGRPNLEGADFRSSPPSSAPSKPSRSVNRETRPEIAWLSARSGSRKLEALEQYGGGRDTEEAVRRGLEYLASRQRDHGGFGRLGTDDQKYGDVSVGKSALVLLAFLGAGHHPTSETQYRAVTVRIVNFLLRRQDPETGHFGAGTSSYSHGIATYALGEAFLLCRDETIGKAVERATGQILRKQVLGNDDSRLDGGWNYYYSSPRRLERTSYPRVSVTVWQVMALKTAELAGIAVPRDRLNAARAFLTNSWSEDWGTFLYTREPQRLRARFPTLPGSHSAAVFALQVLGARSDSELMNKAVAAIDRSAPERWAEATAEDFIRRSRGNPYCWYYSTLALFRRGGEPWARWNEELKQVLLPSQTTDGSWNPISAYADYAADTDDDRSYTTALNVLMLEVYYRYLTPWQQSLVDQGGETPR